MKIGMARADLGVGIFVFGLGVFALFGTISIPQTPLYAAVGAKLVPYLCAALLMVLGCYLMLDAMRGGWSRHLPDADGAPMNWRAFGLLAAGALVNMVLIDPLGFVIAASGQFALTVRAFGSRKLLRDILIGITVTLAAYLGFNKGLGVNIGAGVLEGLL